MAENLAVRLTPSSEERWGGRGGGDEDQGPEASAGFEIRGQRASAGFETFCTCCLC